MNSIATRPRPAIPLVAVCAVALAIRLIVAYASPNIAHPDEIFQVLEQAHRLAYGYGVVPWEFREGVRSWILPGLFAGIFKTSDFLFPVPGAYWMGAKIFLALLSLAPVVCGFLWAHRIAGLKAAIITGSFAAVWFELVYFATHSLSEVIAAHLMLAGLYLAFPGVPVGSRIRLAVSGLLLGLALMLRIQLFPGMAIVAIYVWLGRSRQSWQFLALGFGAAVACAGLLDWVTWSYPWQSLWKYGYMSLARSPGHGVFPWHHYLLEFAVYWWAAAIPMFGLIWLGSRRLPLLAAIAVTLLIAHSFVPHKEYRYIYPALALLVILAGLGLCDVAMKFPRATWIAASACLLLTACVSGMLATASNYVDHWAYSRGEIRAFGQIASDPQACGILLWRQRGWTTPGYTGLHRDLPIYEVMSERRFSELESAANYVVTRAPLAPAGAFVLKNSFDAAPRTYLYQRPGACSRDHLSERLLYPDWFGEKERGD